MAGAGPDTTRALEGEVVVDACRAARRSYMVDTMAELSDTRIQCCIQPTSGYNGYNDTMYLKLVSLISLDTMDTMLYPAQFWIQWIRIYHVGCMYVGCKQVTRETDRPAVDAG